MSSSANNNNPSQPTANSTKDLLNPSLSKNIQIIKRTVDNSNDIVIREVTIGKSEKHPIAFIYTDGLADQTVITDFIMESLICCLPTNYNTTCS